MNSGEKQKTNITDFLQRLNRDIEDFIGHSIELSSEIKSWTDLSKELITIRCWEAKSCSKKECPAHMSDDYRCWLQVGTMCRGEVQGDFAKKYGSCFKCEVFQMYQKDVDTALFKNIDILIHHLQKRAAKLHELAMKDQLTSLYNRHFLETIIEREIAGAQRKAEGLSFIMIDMDNFKSINDTLGHFAGDQYIVAAAKIVKRTVRKADLVFRYGGDEFLVIQINSDKDKADATVERLWRAADRWNKDNSVKQENRLSFSIGYALCNEPYDYHLALNDADKRMYENKNTKKSMKTDKIQ